MKFHLTQSNGKQLITGYSEEWVAINNKKYFDNLIVTPDEVLENWEVKDFDSLQIQSFQSLQIIKPELVLLGTGSIHRFIHPRIISALTASNIPVECMKTNAACRTYNILMAEGRLVAAALILKD